MANFPAKLRVKTGALAWWCDVPRWRWRRRRGWRGAEGVLRLSDLEVGAKARVIGFELNSAAYRRLIEMGLTPGTALTVTRRTPGGVLEVLARDVAIAVGPDVADGVLVSVK